MATTLQKEARISSRINSDLKSKGDAILSELGIKPSQAISMFYTQIVRQRGLPLDLKIPNEETIAALNEDVSAYPRFETIDDLMTDLNS